MNAEKRYQRLYRRRRFLQITGPLWRFAAATFLPMVICAVFLSQFIPDQILLYSYLIFYSIVAIMTRRCRESHISELRQKEKALLHEIENEKAQKLETTLPEEINRDQQEVEVEILVEDILIPPTKADIVESLPPKIRRLIDS